MGDSVPSGNGAPLPVWVRATAIVGIPGIIAFFLIWKGATDIARRSDVELLRAHLDRVVAESHMTRQTDLRAVRAELANYIVQAQHNHRMLQQICANTAKDSADRSRCFVGD